MLASFCKQSNNTHPPERDVPIAKAIPAPIQRPSRSDAFLKQMCWQKHVNAPYRRGISLRLGDLKPLYPSRSRHCELTGSENWAQGISFLNCGSCTTAQECKSKDQKGKKKMKSVSHLKQGIAWVKQCFSSLSTFFFTSNHHHPVWCSTSELLLQFFCIF